MMTFGMLMIGAGCLAIILSMGWWGLLWCGLLLAGDALCNISRSSDDGA